MTWSPLPTALIPRHVAIIPDGNGRWAAMRKLPPYAGIDAGVGPVVEAVQGALVAGVSHLTCFGLSTENWRRDEAEVTRMLESIVHFMTAHRDELHAQGVRLQWVGRRHRLPAHIVQALDEAQVATASAQRLTFTACVDYGGRAELADAAVALARAALRGEVELDSIGEEDFATHLYAPRLPDVDLLIRTAGEQHQSNYLLWQTYYAQMVFPPVLWPDFTREHLWDAIRDFAQRPRRFGAKH